VHGGGPGGWRVLYSCYFRDRSCKLAEQTPSLVEFVHIVGQRFVQERCLQAVRAEINVSPMRAQMV